MSSDLEQIQTSVGKTKTQSGFKQNYDFLQSCTSHQTSLSLTSSDLYASRHYGNTIPLVFLPNGQPKYLLGPHWWVFVITVIITSVIGIGILVKFYQEGASILFIIACLCTLIFYAYSYAMVGLSVPGIGSTGMQPDYEAKMNPRYCVPCKNIKQITTRHCYSCDLCITGYDHHCPWVGKCIGSGNMNAFRMFMGSIGLLIMTLMITLVFGLPGYKAAGK